MERREAQLSCLASGIACEAMLLPKAHRLAALHSRRFWARGPYFRMGRANLIRSAFAAFIRIPCSRERQSHVVGPDGDPSLPDDMVANHARRRRILLRLTNALEKRPSRTGRDEHTSGSERGDTYPHHEMFRNVVGVVAHIIRRHSGARVFARARNPSRQEEWIPGLRQAAHPGMTGGEIGWLHAGYTCNASS
jgi:hypothetical protein